MKLKNPTNNDISVIFEGEVLSVKAGGTTEELSEEQVKFWRGIHAFLTVATDTPKVEEKPKVTKKAK